jgi:hypothetical protein
VFIPEVLADEGLEAVYRDQAFVTKRDPRGMSLSSSSQPALMALATAAERLLGGATLGVLLMHQFRDDPCDSVARFAEGSLGGSRGVCHAGGELVEAALNSARVTQQRAVLLAALAASAALS